MPTKFKKTRLATTLMIVASLVAPSVNAASVAQPNAIRNLITLSQASNSEVILAEHRRDHRGDIGNRPDNSIRRDYCRAYPDRCDNANNGRSDRDRDARDNDWDRDRNARNNDWERNRDRRDTRRVDRNDDRRHVRRGYRGVPNYRRGYRQGDDGWWYPLAAFAIGAIIANELNDNRGHYNGGNSNWSHIPRRNMAAHDDWCDYKYRSYSRSTKTFQPYNGPRRYCNSPYDLL